MNLRDLKYLVAVADHLHFGKAAKACHVSQPALSMQIQKLEQYLDIQILERSNKSVFVTDLGQKIIARARDVLQAASEIEDMAAMNKAPYVGNLRLGAFPTIAPYFLPLIVPTISQKFPKLRLLLLEAKTEDLVEKLTSGKIDAALLATTEAPKILQSYPLFQDEFIFAVPKDHEKASQKSVDKDYLLQQPLLLLEEGHCLRDQALDYCRLSPMSTEYDFQATSLETLRQMIAAGVGATLLPKIAMRPDDGIKYIKIKPAAPYRTISLVWRKSSAKQAFLTELAELMKLCYMSHN